MAGPIVVADDHPEMLELVNEVLIDAGYTQVVCVRNGELGKTVARQTPQLVMLSISMSRPEVGWSLLDRLRLFPPTANVPVILSATNVKLLASKSQHLARLHCYVLERPFVVGDLLELVEHIIGPPAMLERTA